MAFFQSKYLPQYPVPSFLTLANFFYTKDWDGGCLRKQV